MTILSSSLVFLTAAVIAVPIFKKLKLGAILGYLIAGVIIGPSVLGFISEAEHILHVAELGVILLLFVIGLELNPHKLWQMRSLILFSGGGQLFFTSIIIAGILISIFGLSSNAGVVVALAVSLSSTAFAIQLMNEHKVLNTPPGKRGFSMLLMQDLAVIPILLLVSALSISGNSQETPWWLSIGAILGVLVAGRFLINPLLKLVASSGSDEVMTASALLIVIATAMAMEASGLSMGLGAFLAGILLANSNFRHQLETEVAPFKGLLLGLFFIAIGMNMDLELLVQNPITIISLSLLLVAMKFIVIFTIMKLGQQNKTDSTRIGLMLSQGGEFAFVVMTQATIGGIIDAETAAMVTLVVGVSMALTSPLIILHSLGFNSQNCPPVYDTKSELSEPEIIIAGFGRFAQITARILAANNIPFTAMDKNPEHIEFIQQFGNRAFYGDASRLDLLKSAGIEHAKILFIAVNDSKGFEIAKTVRKHFPHVKIITRVQNRFAVANYHDIGVNSCVREMFSSGLKAAELVLTSHGISDEKAAWMIKIFEQHDTDLLEEALQKNYDLDTIISKSQEGRKALEELFQQDKKS